MSKKTWRADREYEARYGARLTWSRDLSPVDELRLDRLIGVAKRSLRRYIRAGTGDWVVSWLRSEVRG